MKTQNSICAHFGPFLSILSVFLFLHFYHSPKFQKKTNKQILGKAGYVGTDKRTGNLPCRVQNNNNNNNNDSDNNDTKKTKRKKRKSKKMPHDHVLATVSYIAVRTMRITHCSIWLIWTRCLYITSKVYESNWRSFRE